MQVLLLRGSVIFPHQPVALRLSEPAELLLLSRCLNQTERRLGVQCERGRCVPTLRTLVDSEDLWIQKRLAALAPQHSRVLSCQSVLPLRTMSRHVKKGSAQIAEAKPASSLLI